MASYTPNLDLLKKSPVTDGDDMFNVETMLNENWDRIDRGVGDYTAPAQKMGLTGDLSVGASLGVLANIGNVHVWRKTVTTEEEVPAGYKLVDDNTDRTLDDVPNALINLGNSNQRTAYINCADSITVDDGGGISLNSATTHYQANDALNAASWLRGKYIKLYYINDFGNWFGPPALDQNKTYYVPNDAQISVNSATIIVDKLQRVDAYPLTPAGTHITYLTSTNRNAYQEGRDGSEKPAGYTLGAVKTGKKALSDLSNYIYSVTWQYGDYVAVSDDGKVSIKNPTQISISATNDSEIEKAKVILGKFATPMLTCGFEYGKIYFFPSDSQISREPLPIYDTTTTNIDKHQEVTGYPATPAGTTIEYLGVLGDKTSIETGSYVGTGTFGSGNPNTLTFGFEPKFVHIQSYSIGDGDSTGYGFAFFLSGTRGFTIGPSSSNNLFSLNAKFNKNILSWYQANEYAQLNEKNVKYFFAALG